METLFIEANALTLFFPYLKSQSFFVGSVWDVKHRKFLRSLQTFSGIVANDGKLGIHAPNKGGLHVSSF